MTVEEIEVERIRIGPSQARSRGIEDNTDELAESIEKLGLLQPIVVFRRDEEYELLTGQRRLIAVRKLGWKRILANIVDPPGNPAMAKALSLTENFMRKELQTKDLTDACTELYHHYGTMKAVSEELGLPYSRVRKYVKFARLEEDLQKIVEDGKVSLDTALKAQDAATLEDGTVDLDKALMFVGVMGKMTGTQQKELVKTAQDQPAKSAEEVIKEASKPPREMALKIVFLTETLERLDKYSEDTSLDSREEAVTEIVSETLDEKGY